MNSRNRGRTVPESAVGGDTTSGQHKAAQATESQSGGDDPATRGGGDGGDAGKIGVCHGRVWQWRRRPT